MRHAATTLALLLGAASVTAAPALLAQDQDSNSAVDASGQPIGMAEEGAVGGPEIVGTDGLIRYENAEEMWQTISSNWDTLGEKATERWSEIDSEELMATEGDREQLVSLVSENYDIEEAEADQEVTAWATSANDGM